MEYTDVFAGLAVLVVGLIAIFGFSADFQGAYGGTSITTDINNSENLIGGVIGNLSTTSGEVGDAGTPEEGASVGTGEDNLVTRGLQILGAIPRLAGLPLALMEDVGEIFNIDPRIVEVAKYVFTFVFFLTLGYIFILGVRKLI